MKVGPCKGCLDRALGCHQVCRSYQDWKIMRQAELDWLREQNPEPPTNRTQQITRRLRRDHRAGRSSKGRRYE